jgi:hypothetical protein
MLKRLAILIAVLLLLAFILDPYTEYIKNSAEHFSHKIFGINDTATEDDADPINNINTTIPSQPEADSIEILKGIDSIESSSKPEEIITK